MSFFTFVTSATLLWIATSTFFAPAAVSADTRDESGRLLKKTYPKYYETPGYHKTGKYIVFGVYADTQCSAKQLNETHGYPLGVCQPFTVPNKWWMNYAGTSTKGTFLLYQFFDDQDCTKPSDTSGVVTLPAIGYENWSKGCNYRGTYSKTFNVQDSLPSFSGGTLVLQFLSEAACNANKVDGSTNFLLAKPGKCVGLMGSSSLVNNPGSPGTFFGVIISCSSNGALSVKVYEDPENCNSASYQKTNTITKADYCVPNKSATGDILGYVNAQCV